MHRLLSISLAALCAAIATNAEAQAKTEPYAVAQEISAPDGRWDFASWDEAHHRLLVAHGKDALIIDPAQPGSVRTIGDLAGAHQVLAIPGGDRLLATSGHDNTVRVFDLAAGTQIASIAVAEDPDAAILSPDGHRVYVMAAKAGAISVVDLDSMKEVGRINVKPALEVPAWVDDHMLAVNDEDANEIELVDTAGSKHIGAVALPGCEGPTGLAYAPSQHMALSACANGKAALVDMTTRKMVKLIPIGEGPDTVIWDGQRNRFLVPSGKSGTLSIIALNNAETQSLPSIKTAKSARTGALDPATGRIYLPAATFRPAANGQRPAMVTGSFHILVLNPID